MRALTTLEPRTSRKTHRKSRFGCLNCKRRHIKCDELKPQCTNCTSHSSVCDYSFSTRRERDSPTEKNPPSSHNVEFTFVNSEYQDRLLSVSSTPHNSETTGRQLQLEQDPPPSFGAQFTLLDLKLQHQFLTSTCLTLAEDEGSLHFWRTLVPCVGYSSPFVLQLTLALGGLHRRRSAHSGIPCPLEANLDNRIEYHYMTGLHAFRHALANMTPHTSYPVWIGSILLCFISMARGPRTGNYLFFSTTDDQPSEWISLLKGIQALSSLDELRPHTSPKEASPHQSEPVDTNGLSCKHKVPESHSYLNYPPKHPLGPSCCQAIQLLKDLMFTHFAANSLKEKHLATLSFLHQALMDLGICTSILTPSSSSSTTTTSEPCLGSTSSTSSANPNLKLTFIIWTWTSLLDDGLDALQRKEPIPLLLLALFLALFKQLDDSWFARGWAEHTLTGIEEVLDGVLDGKWREVLKWPKEVILGKIVC